MIIGASFPHFPMFDETKEDTFLAQIDADIERWEAIRELAGELVRDRGWSQQDEDYWFQVEREARQLWQEDTQKMIL